MFHDSRDALIRTWDSDKKLLEANDYFIDVIRERSSFVEAVVTKDDDTVLNQPPRRKRRGIIPTSGIQWGQDSAFRFFPLITHEDFGLTLHPFDLATNKVLALAGRLKVRDWIDVINSHDKIQPLGYLIWAACGKDPGFNPAMIIAEAARSSHYSHDEVAELSFSGNIPDVAQLSRHWKSILAEAKKIVAQLPIEEIGKCILNKTGGLSQYHTNDLSKAIENHEMLYHPGALGGVLPTIHDCP